MAKFDAKCINTQYNIKITLIRQKKQKKKQPKLMTSIPLNEIYLYFFIFWSIRLSHVLEQLQMLK